VAATHDVHLPQPQRPQANTHFFTAAYYFGGLFSVAFLGVSQQEEYKNTKLAFLTQTHRAHQK
jgi:hypothetical protein